LAPARLTESRLESKKRLERLGARDHDTGRRLEHGKFHEGLLLGFVVQAVVAGGPDTVGCCDLGDT